jgi:ferrous-iron efflux pump FieF
MHNDSLVQWVSRSSVAVAAILIAGKVYAVYMTGSLSILSSLLDSAMDMVASLGNLVAVTIAAKPADKKFRFGYGKLEAVSALMKSLLIIGSIIFLVFEAIQRFFQEESAILNPEIGMWVMVLSIVLTMGLTLFQQYVIRKTNSIAVKADALHYHTDLAVNVVVIGSLYLSRYYSHVDSIACLLISGYVVWSIRGIIGESLAVLLDKEIPSKDKQTIIAVLNNHPKVMGFHNFRTRTSGKKIFIEAHVEMDPSLTLIEAHTIAHELKDAVLELYPESEMIVHQDPVGHDAYAEQRF